MKRHFACVIAFVIMLVFTECSFAQSFQRTTTPLTVSACTTLPNLRYMNGIGAQHPDSVSGNLALLQDEVMAAGQPSTASLDFVQGEQTYLDIATQVIPLAYYDKKGHIIADGAIWIENKVLALMGEAPLSGDDGQQVVNFYLSLAQADMSAVPAENLSVLNEAVIAAAKTGTKIVEVGHSVGSLYANSVWDTLQAVNVDDTKFYDLSHAMQVVDVANLGSRAPSNKYITLTQDEAVQQLTKAAASGLFYAPMNANFTANYVNPPGGVANLHDRVIGHGFKEDYIAPDLSVKDAVIAQIIQAVQDAGSFGFENPDGPVSLSGMLLNANASFSITAPNGSMTEVSVTPGTVGTTFWSQSCQSLQEGTYSVVATLAPLFNGYPSMDIGPSRASREKAPVYVSGMLTYPINTETSVQVMDIEVKKNKANGGFDISYYPYNQPM